MFLEKGFINLVSRKPEFAKILPNPALQRTYSHCFDSAPIVGDYYSENIETMGAIYEQSRKKPSKRTVERWHEYTRHRKTLNAYDFFVKVCERLELELPLTDDEIDILSNTYHLKEDVEGIERLKKMTERPLAYDVDKMREKMQEHVNDAIYSELERIKGMSERERENHFGRLGFNFHYIERCSKLTGIEPQYDADKIQELNRLLIKYGNVSAITQLTEETKIKPVFDDEDKPYVKLAMRKALEQKYPDLTAVEFLITNDGTRPDKLDVLVCYRNMQKHVDPDTLVKLFLLSKEDPGEVIYSAIKKIAEDSDYNVSRERMKKFIASGIKTDSPELQNLCTELFNEGNFRAINLIKQEFEIDPGLDPDAVKDEYRRYDDWGRYYYKIPDLHEASGIPPRPELLVKAKLHEGDINGALQVLEEHSEIELDNDDKRALKWLKHLQNQLPD